MDNRRVFLWLEACPGSPGLWFESCCCQPQGTEGCVELWCLCVCAKLLQSCLTLFDPMDQSPPDSFVHKILQARILEWITISFSRGSSIPRDQTQVSCITGRFFTTELPRKPIELWGLHKMPTHFDYIILLLGIDQKEIIGRALYV